MIDSKLRRASIMKGSAPSCLLLDPDFAGGSPTIETIEPLAPDELAPVASEEEVVEDNSASVNATVASAAVGSATTGGTFTLSVHKLPTRIYLQRPENLMLCCITSSN